MEVKEGSATSEWKSLLITKVLSAVVATAVLFLNSQFGLNLEADQIVNLLLGAIGFPAIHGAAYAYSRGKVKAAASSINVRAATEMLQNEYREV